MAIKNASTRRVLNVLSYLMHNHRVLLKDLAREFDVSLAEMKKIVTQELQIADITPLQQLNSVTAFLDEDENGEIRVDIAHSSAFQTPLRLLDEEAYALRLLLSAYEAPRDDYAQETIKSLQAKLSAAVGSEEEEDNIAKAETSKAIDEIVASLEDASAYNNVVEIEYYSAEHRERMRRRVQPYILFQEAGRFYLRGFCEYRQAVRSFRIDRIAEVEVLEDTFTPPKGAAQVPSAVPGFDGIKVKETFTILVEPAIADEIERQWEGRARSMTAKPDGSLELKLPLYSRAWALGWVLSLGPNAELLAPERLRESLIDRIDEMLASTSV